MTSVFPARSIASTEESLPPGASGNRTGAAGAALAAAAPATTRATALAHTLAVEPTRRLEVWLGIISATDAPADGGSRRRPSPGLSRKDGNSAAFE
jgi:hypothetical protein